MNPFFFGRSDRPLFGVYTHARTRPGAGSDEARSVLLCYPLGSEYMRAHRAFRQLNNLLVRGGMNVLRFDYSCTGDSAGDGAEATIAGWLEDVDWAIDELKDNAMSETVTVVGLRWGATLAALACAGRDDVEHLVLWDPVVSGRRYLDDRLGTPRPTGLVGIEGFPFTQELRDAMDAIDLREAARALEVPVSVMVAEDRPEDRELERALLAAGRGAHFEVVPSPGDWAQADPFGDALIPQQIIQAIVDRLLTQVVP